MISWIKQFFQQKKQRPVLEDNIKLRPVHQMVAVLNRYVLDPRKKEDFETLTNNFFSRVHEEQVLKNCPMLYLRYEQYLIQANPNAGLSRNSLRKKILEQVPELVEIPSLKVIFKDGINEELELSRLFLSILLGHTINVLGQAQNNFFEISKTWVDQLPYQYFPHPFLENANFEVANIQDYLTKVSQLINQTVEYQMGPTFAQRIYDTSYNELAKNYRYLDAFPVVISLIPRKYLDEEKMSLMSRHQLTDALLEKVVNLEDLNKKLEKQNKALEETHKALAQSKQQVEKRKKELERTQRELELTINELKESNRELEQFAYVASHDLQEPLRSVSSYVQLIERFFKDEEHPELKEYIDFSVTGVKRMQRLIKDLLEYSRVGRIVAAPKEVYLDEVFRVVKHNLKELIRDSNTKLQIEGVEEVIGNHSQLVQLFQNLISNSIKFRKEEVQPEIYIRSECQDEDWLFEVRDNGIGISENFKDSIFVIFHKLHPKHEYSGTGIGLAICKKIVERHGGNIWIESEIGKGTSFFFTISKNLKENLELQRSLILPK